MRRFVVDQLGSAAFILGIALLVTAVVGLAGWWWAAAAAGVALVALGVLDERGRRHGQDASTDLARRRAEHREDAA